MEHIRRSCKRASTRQDLLLTFIYFLAIVLTGAAGCLAGAGYILIVAKYSVRITRVRNVLCTRSLHGPFPGSIFAAAFSGSWRNANGLPSVFSIQIFADCNYNTTRFVTLNENEVCFVNFFARSSDFAWLCCFSQNEIIASYIDRLRSFGPIRTAFRSLDEVVSSSIGF